MVGEVDEGIELGGGPWALVTRPEPQATQWVSKLRAQGVRADALPLLEIAGAPDPAAVRAMFDALCAAALPAAEPLAMFVSPNAALRFFECLPADVRWPAAALAGATGPGTAAALLAAGVPTENIVVPPPDAGQFESEALWAQLRGRGWAGREAWIVRGEGGRDWFAQTLRTAGVSVATVQSYQRRAPQLTADRQVLLARALAQPESVRWLLSSSEAVGHLGALVPDAHWLGATALASHPRIAERARALGFGRVVELRPTVQAVVEAIGGRDPAMGRD